MNPSWQPLSRDFSAWMKYRNLADSTQRIYLSAVRDLSAFLRDDRQHAEVVRRDIEAFVQHRLERVNPATVSADFRALQQFSSGWSARTRSRSTR